MNLNNVSGYIAKSGAKVRLIYRISNTGEGFGKDDNWVENVIATYSSARNMAQGKIICYSLQYLFSKKPQIILP